MKVIVSVYLSSSVWLPWCCVGVVQVSVVALVFVLSRALDQIQPDLIRAHSQTLLELFIALLDYRVTANEVGVVVSVRCV